MLDINFKQLEAFVAVAESRSFTEAAARIFLAQSTVSSHVAALERTLDLELICRGNRRRLSLTADGERIYLHAKEILQHCEALCKEADEERQLILGASTIPGQYILPGLLSSFHKLYPNADFVIRKGDSDAVHEMILKGSVQLGFVGTAQSHGELSYTRLAQDELVLITPNTPRFKSLYDEGVSGMELLSEPLIFRESGSGTQRAVDQFLEQSGVNMEKLRIVARMDSLEAIAHSVMAELGVSITSDLAVKDPVERGQLLRFPLSDKGVFRHFYLLRRKNWHPSSLSMAFLAHCVDKSK